ncbi:MAG: mechanosensitive ion channel [Thermodesulfobacteriota bacterium]|nr:mechanosensitive ion channel [Thermodesulfobacteriota bacterium]
MNPMSISLHHGVRILSAMLLVLFFSFSVSIATDLTKLVPTQPAEQASPVVKQPEPPKMTIPNLITYTTRLSEELIDLDSQLADIALPDDAREELPGIEKALESMNWKAMMQQADSNLSYEQLSYTMLLLNQHQVHLNSIAEPLNKAIKILAEQGDHWNEEADTLTTWVETLNNKKAFPLFQQNTSELQKSIESAVETIDSRTSDTLETLQTISGLQVKLYNLKVSVGDLLEDLRKEGWQQTSPSIFTHKFYAQLNPALLSIAWQNGVNKLNKEVRLVRVNNRSLLLVLMLPILLSIVFIKNRKNLQKHPNWSMLTDCPVAFSVFTCMIFIVPWLGTSIAHIVPITSIALVFSVMLLAGKLEKKSVWRIRFIYLLSIFIALNILVDLINLPLPLQRIYLLAGSCCWLAYFTWRFLATRPGIENRYFRWFLPVAILALTAIIFTAIFGYDELARYLFRGVFQTLFTLIASIILFNASKILLELLLTLLPIIRRYADVIGHALRPLVFILCVLIFYVITAVIWHLYPTAGGALSGLAALGLSLGDFTLTMNMVFMIVGIFYGAILVSRATQSILMNEVLPRYNIDKGVQLSITRLVHYMILLIGSIILLQALGLDLTKLTILGGALSVGIGFGLQTIVNNFASGLILLFERPIKVGDTIELGTEMGEVKKLGLRSTIIQTFDNAEIVVPNSDLIAGQVTNWTLAERKARVKIPVGVAYGSDIPKVLEILLAVAGEHPMILTTPAPNALFLAFGASSLDFELRVWIAEFTDRKQVQSELNQEINSEFADAGIEIPFPQTDLHLRTVDDGAAEVLRSTA